MTYAGKPEGRVDHGSTEVNLFTPKVKKLRQELVLADFTDNTNATGYADFDSQLPAGAIPLAWKAVVSAGFAGNVSAVMQVGVAGDLDRFSNVTDQSVFAAGTVGSRVADDALDGIAAAQTPRVTVTASADFTAVSAGAMVVELYYIES